MFENFEFKELEREPVAEFGEREFETEFDKIELEYTGDDPVKAIVAKIKATPLLSREEETDLGVKIALGGPDAKAAVTKLTEHNMRLVLSIAHKFTGSGQELMELFNMGNVGLMKAAWNFDVTKGCRFSTYATPKIEGDISYAFNKDKKSFLSNAVSLDTNVGKEEDCTLAELIADPAPTPEQHYAQNDLRDSVSKALQILSERDRTIVILAYGLNGTEKKTYTEIGRMFSISERRAAQITKEAGSKLKNDPKWGKILKTYLVA